MSQKGIRRNKLVHGDYGPPHHPDKNAVVLHPQARRLYEVKKQPMITASNKINSLPATPFDIPPSFSGRTVLGIILIWAAAKAVKGGFVEKLPL